MSPAEHIRERQQVQRQQDLAWLLSDARGRRVMWSLICAAGMFGTTAPSRTEREAAFAEGERNTALRLWAQIGETAHERLLMMQAEAADAEMRAQAEIKSMEHDKRVDDGN